MEIELKFLDENRNVVEDYAREYLSPLQQSHFEKFIEVLILQSLSGNQPVLDEYVERLSLDSSELARLRKQKFRSVGELLNKRLWDIVEGLL